MIAELPVAPFTLLYGKLLLERIRRERLPVLVAPRRYNGTFSAFAYLITDSGRERINLQALGALIKSGKVRVQHVLPNGELMYEAVA